MSTENALTGQQCKSLYKLTNVLMFYHLFVSSFNILRIIFEKYK